MEILFIEMAGRLRYINNFVGTYRKLICGVDGISWRKRILDVPVNSSGIHDRDRKTDCYMNL